MRSQPRLRTKARGYIVIALMLSLSLGIMFLGAKLARQTPDAHTFERRDALHSISQREEARLALLGRAIADSNAPGGMSLPDCNGDGLALGCTVSSPPTVPRVTGCLPWKTLGLESGTNAFGAPLMYSLSTSWRTLTNNKRTPTNESDTNYNRPINPGNPGSIDLQDAAGITTKIVAAIIDPGAEVPGQLRSGIANPCAAGVGSQYLDTVGGINNADSTKGTLATAPIGTNFNDAITPVRREHLIAILMKPVLELFSNSSDPAGKGLWKYLQHLPAKPGDLQALQTPAHAQQPMQVMNRNAMSASIQSNTFDGQFDRNANVDPTKNFATYAAATSAPYCANDNGSYTGAFSWLCANNWYSYLEYKDISDAAPRHVSVELVLDRTKPGGSRSCKLLTPEALTGETLTCASW
jgi:hypothetical protein